jgi:hypothetical protein
MSMPDSPKPQCFVAFVQARNERGVASHPRLAAAWGVAESVPVAVLVVAAITQLQNTSINRRAVRALYGHHELAELAARVRERRHPVVVK